MAEFGDSLLNFPFGFIADRRKIDANSYFRFRFILDSPSPRLAIDFVVYRGPFKNIVRIRFYCYCLQHSVEILCKYYRH